jgi:hypothetical protein
VTIRPGEAWERPAGRIDGLATARTDRELVAVAASPRVADGPAGPVLLLGGDLHRTLGSPVRRPDPVAADVDVLEVTDSDTGEVLGHAVAHVVVAPGRLTGGLFGDVIVACNSGHVGPFELAPRAHPGDGVVDVVTVSRDMPVRQRLTALARARSGSHLPHPDITVSRVESYEIVVDRPAMVRLDGVRVGRVRALAIRVVPDAVTIVF